MSILFPLNVLGNDKLLTKRFRRAVGRSPTVSLFRVQHPHVRTVGPDFQWVGVSGRHKGVEVFAGFGATVSANL